MKSLVIAAGLTPLDSSVPYTDIMSDVGYVARAYEMGCTDTARYFYPDSLISRTEMLELSDCIDSAAESYIASSTVGSATTDTIVPNTPDPSTPVTPQIIYITGATTEKVVEKVITEQTTVYVTGSTEPSLPSSPNTLLGYDDAGNIINI